MNLKEAMLIAAELAALNEIAAQIQTGDGRWDLLQDWLDENPEWKKRINIWVKLTPVAAYEHLRRYICERLDVTPSFVKMFIGPELDAKIKTTIETIQACYRERAGMVAKKEIHP